MQQVLVIIDMVRDFVDPQGALFVPGAPDTVPVIAGLKKSFRQAGRPVVYLLDRHAANDPEFADWPPHSVRGTPGAEVVDELAPEPGDEVVDKTFIEVFNQPEVERTLTETRAETLVVTGTATEHCVRATVLGGLARGYRVLVVLDGVSGVEAAPGDVDRAFEEMREAGAEFVDAEQAAAGL
jgi:nicotinamidase-related amidase